MTCVALPQVKIKRKTFHFGTGTDRKIRLAASSLEFEVGRLRFEGSLPLNNEYDRRAVRKYGMMGGLVWEAVTAVLWSQHLSF